MPKKKITPPVDIGPLAALSAMCDQMEIMLDPGRKWYPSVGAQLRRLDYAIRWEIDRLSWEAKFLTDPAPVLPTKANGKRMDRRAREDAIAIALGIADE